MTSTVQSHIGSEQCWLERGVHTIISDICNQESILVSFRIDTRYQLAGMTTDDFSV